MNRCPACNRPLVTTTSGLTACANGQCVGPTLGHTKRITAAERPGAARLLRGLVRQGLAPDAIEAGAQLALTLDDLAREDDTRGRHGRTTREDDTGGGSPA